jgi:hypothetical protein
MIRTLPLLKRMSWFSFGAGTHPVFAGFGTSAVAGSEHPSTSIRAESERVSPERAEAAKRVRRQISRPDRAEVLTQEERDEYIAAQRSVERSLRNADELEGFLRIP